MKSSWRLTIVVIVIKVTVVYLCKCGYNIKIVCIEHNKTWNVFGRWLARNTNRQRYVLSLAKQTASFLHNLRNFEAPFKKIYQPNNYLQKYHKWKWKKSLEISKRRKCEGKKLIYYKILLTNYAFGFYNILSPVAL